MGLRNRWEFTYAAATLVAPTRAKRDYHAERVAFWEGELTDAKAAAERAEQAMRGAAPPINYELSRVAQAEAKLREHQGQVTEYEMFLRLFAAFPAQELTLDTDDFVFFGL